MTTLTLEIGSVSGLYQQNIEKNIIIMEIEKLKWYFVEWKLQSRSDNSNSK